MVTASFVMLLGPWKVAGTHLVPFLCFLRCDKRFSILLYILEHHLQLYLRFLCTVDMSSETGGVVVCFVAC